MTATTERRWVLVDDPFPAVWDSNDLDPASTGAVNVRKVAEVTIETEEWIDLADILRAGLIATTPEGFVVTSGPAGTSRLLVWEAS